MKKIVRSSLSVLLAVGLLLTSISTGTFALSDNADNLRKQVISAINGLDVTKDTTADDIIEAVASVDENAITTWKVDFTKVLPTNGAIITLNGEEVEGGVVRAHDGSIKGILNVVSIGANFDVAVDFTLKATYETIDCTKQATINTLSTTDGNANASYATAAGSDPEADLVVIDKTSGVASLAKNYFKGNTTIKAVIFKNAAYANIEDSAFEGTTSLQTVVFNTGIKIIKPRSFWNSGIKYVEFGAKEEILQIRTNAFAYCRNLQNLYIGGYTSLNMNYETIFNGDENMKQLTIDFDSIDTVNAGILNTNHGGTASITTVVCNNSTVANAFDTAGAAAAVDTSKTAMVDYYTEVSAMKVFDDVNADYVLSAAQSLDTKDAFTVSAKKNGKVFEVTITDANSVTVTAYVETFSVSDLQATVQKVQNAINSMTVTADTTADDIEDVVASVDSNAVVTWKVDFTKVLPTNGAIIKLNGEEVDGGVVRAHDGSIKGIINVSSGGAQFDVVVDFTLKATYETINCTKQATINTLSTTSGNANASYATATGSDPEADLVVIDVTSGTDLANNYFLDNETIKAVIIKGTRFRDVGDNAFKNTSSLQAVVFNIGARIIKTGAFYNSNVKYIDFYTNTTDGYTEVRANAFSYCDNLQNLYIGLNTLKLTKGQSFVSSKNVNQITVNVDLVDTVLDDCLKTGTEGTITVVCNNATDAAKFANSGAAAVIDLSKTAIVDYCNKVSAIKVIDDVAVDYVLSAANALDTNDAFTVTATKQGNAFEVTITDANSVTATVYVQTFTFDEIKVNVEKMLDAYSYTDETTQADVNTYIQSILGSEYELIWLEEYKVSQKVNGAEVWARESEEVEDYDLYATVPGQDKAVHGIFVIKKGTDTALIELNKVLEKAEYEKYELTGICETDGSGGGSESAGFKTTYDGTSELVIVNGKTVYTSHLKAASIDGALGGSYSQNIKAVILNANPGENWSCFESLTGLEVAIINNTTATSIGNSVFRYCSNLKYVYIPDNILTTKIGTKNDNNVHAFYGCSAFTVLVPEGFVATSLRIGGTSSTGYTYATCVTRYAGNAEANKLIDFYNKVSAILSAASVDELDAKIKTLSSYDESYTVSIEFDGSEFVVTINDLFVVKTPVTTPEGIKKNIANYLSSNSATNDTTADDVLNAVLDVPGVANVVWSTEYGFEKILATNGAQITLKGEVIEDGIVRGHYGSITGMITVTTTFGDTFDAKVAIVIDPTYEIIDCNSKAVVTIDSDDDTYLTSGGNIFADLVMVNVKSENNNVPANFFGATSTINNRRIKAVIFKDDVSTVLEKAFQFTTGLQAVVFRKVNSFNTQAFWASNIKYIELGSTGNNFNIGDANVFGYCRNLNNLYIADRNSVTIGNGAFVGCENMAQLYVEAETISRIGENAFYSNHNADASTTTVICKGQESVSKCETAEALAVIDANEREISTYDVNYDFNVNVIDLMELKKMMVAQSNDTRYDVDNDGIVANSDLTNVRKDILDVPQKDNVIYVGEDTKVSAETTVQNFGNYSSVSDSDASVRRNNILSSKDTITASGTTWYISNDGDDNNLGNSPDAPWKTLRALEKNDDKIQAGDAVLFNRGDIFRGRIETKSNVSYGAYGEGDKPTIYGSRLNYANEAWVRIANDNVYSLRVDISTDIGMIIFNHGEAYGYKMLNNISECDSDYEFYHDRSSGILYLYCSSGRPSDVFYDIELLSNRSIIHVPNGSENIYIENISAKYTGGHGISVGMPVSGVTIKNCEIGWIGGSIHKDDNTRYGNGIQFYGQTTDAVVENCWVYQCYDAGLTHQYTGSPNGNPEMTAENISYINNLVEFCTYSLEYFWNWKIDGKYVENTNVYMKDILVEKNIMRFAGYGLGKTRPDSVNVGHIVTWSGNNSNQNFVVKNNTFDMSALRLFAVSTYEDANPTFVGNKYIQSADARLGHAYTNNKANGGIVDMTETALKNFDSTGTLTIIK